MHSKKKYIILSLGIVLFLCILISVKKLSVTASSNSVTMSFEHIQMVSKTTGFGISTEHKLLKTTTNGKKWFNLDTSIQFDESSDLSALSEKAIYIAYFDEDNINFLHSLDGGIKWISSSLNADIESGSLQLQMIDESNGFLLVSGQPAASIMPKALYQTKDGCLTWTEIASTSALSQLSGYTNDMYFLNSSLGFILCEYRGEDLFECYRTIDFGETWSLITLNIPDELMEYNYINAISVQYANAETIDILLEFRYDDTSRYAIFNSMDDGITWNYVHDSSDKILQQSYIDQDLGFGIDANGSIYRTTNSGLDWSLQSK